MIVRLRHVKDLNGKDTSAFVDQIIHITMKTKVKDELTGLDVDVDQPYILAGDTTHIKNYPPETKIVTQIEIPETDLVMCRDFVLKCKVGVKKMKIRGDNGKEKLVDVPDYNQFGRWLECIDIPEKVLEAVGL